MKSKSFEKTVQNYVTNMKFCILSKPKNVIMTNQPYPKLYRMSGLELVNGG